MITIGRSIRWYNDYLNEAEFSRNNGFDFMQIWFKNGEIMIDKIDEPKEAYIKKAGFPVIIHALFKIDDFEKYGDQLIELASGLGHREVIIHPICRNNEIKTDSILILSEAVHDLSIKAEKRDITVYLENNSRLDKFLCTSDEIKLVFDRNPNVELLLDIAHIDSFEHLKQIISVKYPKCLHAAGKHFNVIHEHLPLGQGDIDYNLVFSKYLHDYDGRIILEVIGNDEEIIESKKIIDAAIFRAE